MQKYQFARQNHWSRIASEFTIIHGPRQYYHRRLETIFKSILAPGLRVLELGSGTGDLLAALEPSYGVGIDFSPAMVNGASSKYPRLHFHLGDVHTLECFLNEAPFDAIILSDLINDLWDVQQVFKAVASLCRPGTRLVINFYNRLWQWPLAVGQNLGHAQPVLEQNWLTCEDVTNLLHLANLEPVRCFNEILLPLNIPLVEGLFNRFLVKLWPFSHLALTNFIIARPSLPPPAAAPAPSVSVIVPACNEAGNIENAFQRLPSMGSRTELIFVEGNSKDNTYAAIEQAIAHHPGQAALLFKQGGCGKGDAVRKGFDEASGDILMILDADLTVPPEDLQRFYEAICSGKGEFVNGVRLVYPMEKEAMRFFNVLGNKFFSTAFSWLLGQPVKDTLCGTKVLWKRDYELIKANRAYFGDFDPFGDFDLLFGAAKLNRKIIDLPVRYRERVYGQTNIQRWKHGFLLLRMVVFAARRLKFI
jgi:SAM-dependent methyltransferase